MTALYASIHTDTVADESRCDWTSRGEAVVALADLVSDGCGHRYLGTIEVTLDARGLPVSRTIDLMAEATVMARTWEIEAEARLSASPSWMGSAERAA